MDSVLSRLKPANRIPASIRPYALLARWDRPIGTWLLLLPALWTLALAGDPWPDARLSGLFALGAVVMRGAGCTMNDLLDRDMDGRVQRTATRPLPAGMISPVLAGAFLLLQLALGLAVLLQLNNTARLLGVAVLPLVLSYPLAKRLTWWPQAVLGIVFNWGALMGFAAATGTLALPAFMLYAAGFFWTMGYDTIYAYQDIEDDARIGVKSSARALGKFGRAAIFVFYLMTATMLLTTGLVVHMGWLFFPVLACGFLHLLWQVAFWRPDDCSDCLRRFKSNRDFGLIVFAAILFGRVTML